MTKRKKVDKNRISIIVVDDLPLTRQEVIDAISSRADFKVIGESGLGDHAWDLIRDRKPQVAILDVNLPGMNGMEITMNIIAENLPTRVILFTGYDDNEQAIHAVLAGAKGYFSKEAEIDALAKGIRAVVDGNYAINGNIFNQLELDAWIDEQMESIRNSYIETASPVHPLSDREMEVLSHVVQGMSNKEIANLLNISHHTVKNHIISILRKFKVEDRTQAVVYALRRGWVKLQDTQ